MPDLSSGVLTSWTWSPANSSPARAGADCTANDTAASPITTRRGAVNPLFILRMCRVGGPLASPPFFEILALRAIAFQPGPLQLRRRRPRNTWEGGSDDVP